MGAYDDPKIQQFDFSAIEKSIASFGDALVQRKKERRELQEKIDIRTKALIDQKLGLQKSINNIPVAEGDDFQTKIKTELNKQLLNIQEKANKYAQTGDINDYDEYMKLKENFENSIPRLTTTIDVVNQDLSQLNEAIKSGLPEGAKGAFSYSTKLYAIDMAKNYVDERGTNLKPTYDSKTGQWNFIYNHDGKDITLNGKGWVESVNENGESAIIKYAPGLDYEGDKKKFSEIVGPQYKGTAVSSDITPTTSKTKEGKDITTGGSVAGEDWTKANEVIMDKFEDGEYDNVIDAVLDADRWEGYQNYSKFGPYNPGSNIKLVTTEDGEVVGYIDSYGDDEGEWYLNDGTKIEEKQRGEGKLYQEKTMNQQDYFREQTWNNWLEAYGRGDITTSKRLTKSTPQSVVPKIPQKNQ